MNNRVRCTWLLFGLIGVSGIAAAQLTNPPPTRSLSGYSSFESSRRARQD